MIMRIEEERDRKVNEGDQEGLALITSMFISRCGYNDRPTPSLAESDMRVTSV